MQNICYEKIKKIEKKKIKIVEKKRQEKTMKKREKLEKFCHIQKLPIKVH